MEAVTLQVQSMSSVIAPVASHFLLLPPDEQPVAHMNNHTQ